MDSEQNAKTIVLNNARPVVIVVIAILTFLTLVTAIFAYSLSSLISSPTLSNEAIGIVEIRGRIMAADKVVRSIQSLEKDENVKAILIRIDSPGGSASGSQEMLEAIQMISKPKAISLANIAASGGYYVACAGPRIFANPSTLVGSIGVISQVVEFRPILDKFDIKVHTIKTGELKDSGSPFREFNEKDQAYFAGLGQDIFAQFVDQVASSRKLDRAKVLEVADGRVMTAAQAKELGLIDEIGGLQKALAHLAQEAQLSKDYVLVYPNDDRSSLLTRIISETASSLSQELGQELKNLSQGPNFEYLYTHP